MASQQVTPTVVPAAQVVGNAFVHQYYNVLHQSPQMVYRFYQDSSKLGRPEPNGQMSSVTTMAAINDKIMSLDYNDIKAEIKSVDSQESYNQGVLVLVTGSLTAKNNVKRYFTQSFFLAPQDKGYFVLNDMFRYLDEPQQLEQNIMLVNGMNDQASRAPPNPEPVAEPTPVQELNEVDQPAPELEEEVIAEEAYDHSDHGEGSVVEEEAEPVQVPEVVQNEVQSAAEVSTLVPEEPPKKSYASIVKVMKEAQAPALVQATYVARTTQANAERQAAATVAALPVPESNIPSGNGAGNNSPPEAEADGRSIYIRNLPLNATPAQLDEEFRRFGFIKPGGVQVRSNKQQGFCFGFVEFEVSSSVQSAIEASPITIGGRPAYVEEKRPAGSRVSRGRFPLGRGGFRNDGMRGRGGYGGRGYGRGDFSNRGEYGNRGRGSASGRGVAVEGYQRVDQIGNGNRGGRPGGVTQASKNGPRVGPVTA